MRVRRFRGRAAVPAVHDPVQIAFGIGPGESGIVPDAGRARAARLAGDGAARARPDAADPRTKATSARRGCSAPGPGYLVFRHMIPNTIGVILVTLTFAMPRVIFIEAFLSFIGMGVAPPTPSWGSMCNEGIKTMLAHPHELLFPGALHQRHGAGVQLARRRPARRARRAHARPRMSAAAATPSRAQSSRSRSARRVRHVRRHREGRARRELQRRSGQDARDRRRIGLRQVRHACRASWG